MTRRFVNGLAPTERQPDRQSPFQRRVLHAALFLLWCFMAPGVMRAAESSNASPRHVTVPFEVRRGHVMVPTLMNGTNKLSLLLDTGYGMTMLHPDHIASASLTRSGRGITVVGIAGEERTSVFEGPGFDFRGWTWTPRRIAALTSDDRFGSRRRDGILGSGFFRRFVVELHPARKELVLHEPDTFTPSADGEVLALSFKSSTPTVEATVKLSQGREVRAVFEIDTGCDGALCLGNHFVKEHGLAAAVGNEGGRIGVGGSTRIRESRLGQLRLGRLVVEKPEVNLFLEGSPVDAPIAGHIGWDLLKQFHIVFDYSRRQMILKRLE